MKKFALFALAAFCVVLLSAALPAHAEPKPLIWSWGENHWENQDFIPYLENGKHPHNGQWGNALWKAEDWVAQRGSGPKIVEDFYIAGIVRDQYIDDDIPVMEVGPGFYMLGGQDKRRVAETIDRVYGITASKDNGMFMLYDWKTEKPIGSYTRYGLQLQ